MGKKLKVSVLIISMMVGLWCLESVSADCCFSKIIKHDCNDMIEKDKYWINFQSGLCQSRICMDGSRLGLADYYCGKGACNIFGCNCDGGCRSNGDGTWEEALTLLALENRISFAALQDWIAQLSDKKILN